MRPVGASLDLLRAGKSRDPPSICSTDLPNAAARPYARLPEQFLDCARSRRKKISGNSPCEVFSTQTHHRAGRPPPFLGPRPGAFFHGVSGGIIQKRGVCSEAEGLS
jgi:hypothetical protein